MRIQHSSIVVFVVVLAVSVLVGMFNSPGITGEAKAKPQCSDRIDNDKDGYCDYGTSRYKCLDGSKRGDKECVSVSDNKEASDLFCGDGQCSGGESCSSCSVDCGVCPPKCGDGQCNGNETCSSCSQDCGSCTVQNDPACGTTGCSCLFKPYDGKTFIGSLTRQAAVFNQQECQKYGDIWKAEACQYKGVYTNYLSYNGMQIRIPSGDCCCVENGTCVFCSGDLPPIPEGNDPACGTTGCSCTLKAWSGQYWVDSLTQQATVFSQQECQKKGEEWKPMACQGGNVYSLYLIYTPPGSIGSQIGMVSGPCCCLDASGTSCVQCK